MCLQTKGYDPVFGARPVKRAVQRELETGLAKALLRGEFGEDDTGTPIPSASAPHRSLLWDWQCSSRGKCTYMGLSTVVIRVVDVRVLLLISPSWDGCNIHVSVP